ncbi:MAG: DUF2220 family protein [Deltaproteobacteria bacterium]|jgi:hypothetical protein|nr:DUF2220 family protein [Deltaproteobacteria bacterium]
MLGIPDVKKKLLGLFQRRHPGWLMSLGDSLPPPDFPLVLSLKPPLEKEVLGAQEAVRSWIRSWRELDPALGEVRWFDVKWRYLGEQRLPRELVLPDPESVVRHLELSRGWREALRRYGRAAELFPQIKESFAESRHELFEMGRDDFERLLETAAWLVRNPRSGLYPREIPVSGIDSKWLETNKRAVSSLFHKLAGADSSSGDFHERLGLKKPPSLARLLLLDQSLRETAGGLRDFAASAEELGKLRMKPELIVIVENLQTGLSFKDIPGAVLFLGLGYKVDLLGRLPWLDGIRALYWGDIDTHGLAILSRARGYLPRLKSALMDTETFLSHRPLWGRENTPWTGTTPANLTPEEEDLFLGLRSGRWGENLRLEQERISWDTAWPVISRAAEERAS